MDTAGAGPAGEDKHAVKHRKAGTVDSEQLWVTGTGSKSGAVCALEKGKRKRWQLCGARAAPAQNLKCKSKGGSSAACAEENPGCEPGQ